MDRKQYQLQVSLAQNVQSTVTNGFEKYRFVHNALPEINFDEIDVSTEFCGKKLNAPFLISSMTGGSREAGEINVCLARAAEKFGLAFAVGSERVLIESWKGMKGNKGNRGELGKQKLKEILESFHVRKFANPPLLFGNLGAVQLNNGLYFADVKRAVSLIEADGIFLHLNSLQEAIQENGNTNFKEVLKRIEEIMTLADFPVIVKEVGFGMSEGVARQLKKVGVKIVDVAGAGGTNFVAVESKNKKQGNTETQNNTRGTEAKIDFNHVDDTFKSWGIPTAESLMQVKKVAGLKIIASGGVRNGIEVAKAITLGADLVGIALPFLAAAEKSDAAITRCIHTLIYELKLVMFGVGARSLDDLRRVELVKLS